MNLFPAPRKDVPKVLHRTSFENQQAQLKNFFDFLISLSFGLLGLSEGGHVHVDLINIKKLVL